MVVVVMVHVRTCGGRLGGGALASNRFKANTILSWGHTAAVVEVTRTDVHNHRTMETHRHQVGRRVVALVVKGISNSKRDVPLSRAVVKITQSACVFVHGPGAVATCSPEDTMHLLHARGVALEDGCNARVAYDTSRI